jgi:hypothetical protein
VKSAICGFPSRALQKFVLFSFTLFTMQVQLRAFPHFSQCASSKHLSVIQYFMYLFTAEAASGNLFVMACHSDYSDSNFCAPYFQNPSTGMLATLVKTHVHGLFCCFAQHCAQPRLGGKLHQYHICQTGAGREQTTYSEVRKKHSVQHMFYSNH